MGIESDPAYQIGYAVGQMIGIGIFVGPFFAIGLWLYRRHKKNQKQKLA